MLELVNNYYTMIAQLGGDFWTKAAAIGTIASAVTALLAAGLALWMHISSERKRDKDKHITKLEKELSFLKGINAEFLGIKDGLFSIFDNIKKMHDKYLDEKEHFIEDRCENIVFSHTNRDYFMYYEGNSGYIGAIDSTELRNKLVEIYVSIKILFDCLESHKKEAEVFAEVRKMADKNGKFSKREEKMQKAALRSIEYQIPQIKYLKNKIEPMYHNIISLLENEIEKVENKIKI